MPALDISSITGLTDREAQEKLREVGYNELPTSSRRGLVRLVFEIIHEPMFLLLVASGILYFILGDVSEGIMLMSFVLVIIGITVYQERKTERALEALRNLSSPRALVIRDGVQQRIPGRDVVTGDSVILSEGDRVPADSVLLISNNVSVDESLLTGESIPVRKIAGKMGMQAERPGGDDLSFVYSGTLIVQGQGLALVTATGAATEMGKIGTVLQTVERGETRLKLEIRPDSQDSRPCRNLALCDHCYCLWSYQVQLDRGIFGRHYSCHGDPPGGVSGCAHRFSRTRSMEDLTEKRPHPSDSRY